MTVKKKAQRVRAPARANGAAKDRTVFRMAARMRLKHLQGEVKRTGSGLDVLHAISVCAMNDVVIPEWLAIEFMARYRAVTHFRIASWDEAFGRPIRKGAHLSALRKARTKGPAVWLAVNELRRHGKGISKVLFAEVAKQLGLNTTLTETLYYRQKKMMGIPRTS